MSETIIKALEVSELDDWLEDLTDILHACVHGGASVSYVLPFEKRDARAHWTGKVFPGVTCKGSVLFVAIQNERAVGTVELVLDMPPNQPHRCDVSKLLVHPDARRGGIARKLMAAMEARALEEGRRLIVLDTRTGDSAEGLYTSIGYETVGSLPGFARDPNDPDKLDATTYMYKQLID